MLLQVDNEVKSKKAKEEFRDVYERCLFTKLLVHDTTGKLSMMTGEQPGHELDFAKEIKDAATKIDDIPEELPQ